MNHSILLSIVNFTLFIICVETANSFRLSNSKLDGQWSTWSEWSSCTPSCLEFSNILCTKSRYRQCQSPNDKSCIGNRWENIPCPEVLRCPINGDWSDWRITEVCVPFGVKNAECTEGSQAIVRSCNNPPPQFQGRNCVGKSRYRVDCWVTVGCPVGIQPPQDFCVMHSDHTHLVLKWKRTPFGENVSGFELEYWPVFDSSVGTSITHKEPATHSMYNGEYYNVSIPLDTQFQAARKFGVQLRSVSQKTHSSVSTKTYRFGSMDGSWSRWSFYTPCSAKCNSERGSKVRTRSCNKPSPHLDGQGCPGLPKEEISCYGSEMC